MCDKIGNIYFTVPALREEKVNLFADHHFKAICTLIFNVISSKIGKCNF